MQSDEPTFEKTDTALKGPSESAFQRAIISVFILFYITVVILWVCPWSRTKNALIEPLTPHIYYTGVWQGFAVFAPDPRKSNYRIFADIKYDDGSQKRWNYPAMEKLGLFERFCKEHYRKYGNDCLNFNELLWPDFARYVARLNNEKTKHPVTIALIRTSADIPPIEEGLGKPNPEQTKVYQFFLYRVLPEDLR